MSKRKFERIDRKIAGDIFEEITLDKLNGKTPEYTDEQIKILRDYIYTSNINEIVYHLDFIGDALRDIGGGVLEKYINTLGK